MPMLRIYAAKCLDPDDCKAVRMPLSLAGKVWGYWAIYGEPGNPPRKELTLVVGWPDRAHADHARIEQARAHRAELVDTQPEENPAHAAKEI